ncbi:MULTISPECIES: T9SS type A sorting domain-containing protein [Chitinophagaceae]
MSNVKFLLILSCCTFTTASLWAQNYVATAIGVYGDQYASQTTIANGGYITIGNGGNWYMGGSITSTDKGNANTPNSTGRSERILFAGTGTYSNGETAPGGSGNIIDGYATALGKTGAFTLPVGADGLAYPVTIYGSTQVTAAYFPGTGSSQTNVAINDFPDNPATVYSPYLDMPDGIPTGDYDLSYPGFSTPSHAVLLESGNTSAGGTAPTTTYNLLQELSSSYTSSANRLSVSGIKASTATQIYFGVTAYILPVNYANPLQAVRQDSRALLSWTTASEINNKGFYIERSGDGKTWSSIGFVVSKATNGTSGTALVYDFPDISPLSGSNYYRLRQVDLDGAVKYSIVAMLMFTANSNINLYPSPAISFINVTNAPLGAQLKIISLDGKVYKTVTVMSSPQQINVPELASGIYFIQVLQNGRAMGTIRFMKK